MVVSLGNREETSERSSEERWPTETAARLSSAAGKPRGGLDMRFEHWFYALPLRLRSLLGRKQVDQELKDELRDHLELQIKENIAKGMTDDEARRSALRALGGLTQIEEQCRDA